MAEVSDEKMAEKTNAMAKSDVKKSDLLKWDDFLGKQPTEAVPVIYEHASRFSSKSRGWYWASIASKRRGSFIVRILSYSLGVFGVVAPLLAALQPDVGQRLQATQYGLVALAVAGLLQVGDKVFGWSSGWLRYMVTAVAMERLTLQFELDWAAYFIAQNGPIGESDKKCLFDLACDFERDTEKRLSDETDAWVAEFKNGTAALEDMIKCQKEAVEQGAKAARTAMEALAQERKDGAVEIVVSQEATAPSAVTVFIDSAEKCTFCGPSWATTIAAGLHTVRVVLGESDSRREATRAVQVPPDGVVSVDIKL